MTAYLRNPLTYVWAFLALITLASWSLGRGHGADYQINPAITIGVLAIALIKSRFVIRYFMEVGSAPRWLRYACDGWLLSVFGLLLAIYYFSL
ncbi:MAG TPA: cytochrome C oxidase subunit IV family protein [Spongiibacteraceae bacterium]|nr:cytochrome C oxidase subunit IV family protein [Spongiibacteraceae bacterium]